MIITVKHYDYEHFITTLGRQYPDIFTIQDDIGFTKNMILWSLAAHLSGIGDVFIVDAQSQNEVYINSSKWHSHLEQYLYAHNELIKMVSGLPVLIPTLENVQHSLMELRRSKLIDGKLDKGGDVIYGGKKNF